MPTVDTAYHIPSVGRLIRPPPKQSIIAALIGSMRGASPLNNARLARTAFQSDITSSCGRFGTIGQRASNHRAIMMTERTAVVKIRVREMTTGEKLTITVTSVATAIPNGINRMRLIEFLPKGQKVSWTDQSN